MAGNIKGISIEFSANTEKLNGALKKTQGTLNKTQAELKAVNRSLKFNPGNTTLLKQKFELLQRTVTETRQKINDLRKLQNDMKAAGVKESSTQWKQLEREIIKTENQLKMAEGELRRFGSVGKQQILAVGETMKTTGNKIKAAGRTITTSVSVYGMAAIYAGSRLIEMSNKQAQAEQKLQEIYKSRMGVNKKAVQSTLDLASAEQKLGVVGDEVQIAGAQQLATYAKYPSTVNTLLPAMNDLLVQQKGLNGTQEDAVGLANLFGKAMMGQTGALKRAGISFTEAQEEVLKYGTEEEKAAMIAEVVQQNVGNMNEEFAKTDAGKIQQAKNALGDMGEEIGAVLLPAVADLVSWLQDNLLPKIQAFIDFMKEHPNIAKFALALAGIVAVAGPLLMFIGSLITVMGGLVTITGALDIALLPIIGIVAAVTAAIALLVFIGVQLYRNWDTIKTKASQIWNNIQEAVAVVVERVKTNFNTLKTTVSTIWNGIKNAITQKISAAKTAVQTVVVGIATKVSSVWNAIKAKATAVWNAIKTAITRPISSARDAVKKIIDKIKSFFPIKLGKLVSFFLPRISIGSIAKKIGEKLTHAPKFSVGGWTKYAKAANNPYMFNRPTGIIVGDAAQNEIVYGRNSLMRDIASVVSASSLNGVVVNVYGSDNMSVNDLAAAVEQRLITLQNRRSQAWA